MKLLYVCYHVAFLIETHIAAVYGAFIRFVIRVDALMREELIHTLENFHTLMVMISVLTGVLLEEMTRYVREFTAGYHLLYGWKRVRYQLSASLSFVGRRVSPTSLDDMFDSLVMALEQAVCFQSLVLFNVEDNKVIALWHVHFLIDLGRRVKHI